MINTLLCHSNDDPHMTHFWRNGLAFVTLCFNMNAVMLKSQKQNIADPSYFWLAAGLSLLFPEKAHAHTLSLSCICEIRHWLCRVPDLRNKHDSLGSWLFYSPRNADQNQLLWPHWAMVSTLYLSATTLTQRESDTREKEGRISTNDRGMIKKMRRKRIQ